jgi:hypothetical protein
VLLKIVGTLTNDDQKKTAAAIEAGSRFQGRQTLISPQMMRYFHMGVKYS